MASTPKPHIASRASETHTQSRRTSAALSQLTEIELSCVSGFAVRNRTLTKAENSVQVLARREPIVETPSRDTGVMTSWKGPEARGTRGVMPAHARRRHPYDRGNDQNSPWMLTSHVVKLGLEHFSWSLIFLCKCVAITPPPPASSFKVGKEGIHISSMRVLPQALSACAPLTTSPFCNTHVVFAKSIKKKRGWKSVEANSTLHEKAVFGSKGGVSQHSFKRMQAPIEQQQ